LPLRLQDTKKLKSLASVPSKDDVSKLDNPARPKVNHQAGTELCV